MYSELVNAVKKRVAQEEKLEYTAKYDKDKFEDQLDHYFRMMDEELDLRDKVKKQRGPYAKEFRIETLIRLGELMQRLIFTVPAMILVLWMIMSG